MTSRQQLIQLDCREINVITRVAWGWGMDKISNDLGISVNTARTVNQTVCRKLGADNAPNAVALAIGFELIPPDVATNPTLPGGSRVS